MPRLLLVDSAEPFALRVTAPGDEARDVPGDRSVRHSVGVSIDDHGAYWDDQAATFDDEPDHGLTDPETRDAWAALLESFLGTAPHVVVDLGCGTGSVSTLLGQRGHQVLGVDVSPKMVEVARNKARQHELDLEFMVGDVLTATVPDTPCSAVVSRHLLWAFSDPQTVVERWSAPLTPDGLFIAIEGVWDRSGIPPETTFSALQMHFQHVEYTDLSHQSALWGKDVTDHRYAVVGRRPRRAGTA